MRILIVNTQSVNHNNATGITMRSVLQYFSPDDIMELYMQPCVFANDSLPIKSIRVPFNVAPLRCIANAVFKNKSVSEKKYTVAKKQSFKSKLLSRLIMMLDFEPIFLPKHFCDKIKEFNPDCIYTLGNAIDVMNFAIKLSKKLSVPVLPHFMDNWPESHRYGKDKYPGHLRKTQKTLKKLYSHSKCALCISEKMASVYEARHGVPHYALMNSVDVSKFSCDKSAENSKILTYAGGLHLNRYKSLMSIADAVDKINLENNADYILKIYTDEKSIQQYSDCFKDKKCVELNGYVPHDQIKEIYEQSKVLIHIETFDEEYQDFIKYSLSTKISEYLATGRAIFLYAPKEIFMYEYIRDNNVGVAVSKSKDVFKELSLLLESDEQCKKLSENAQALAFEKHNFDKCIDVFKQALEETACENKI